MGSVSAVAKASAVAEAMADKMADKARLSHFSYSYYEFDWIPDRDLVASGMTKSS